MSDIKVLEEMIRPEALVALNPGYGRPWVDLEEFAAAHPPVRIRGLPDDAVVIKVDAFRAPDSIFAGTRGECKRADYVIIADTGGKKRILFIELKQGTKPKHEVIKQLRGAQCFIKYCQEIGRHFWKERGFLDGFEPRFVSVKQIRLAKRKMRTTQDQRPNDTPERMLVISRPNDLEFNHLVGA